MRPFKKVILFGILYIPIISAIWFILFKGGLNAEQIAALAYIEAVYLFYFLIFRFIDWLNKEE